MRVILLLFFLFPSELRASRGELCASFLSPIHVVVCLEELRVRRRELRVFFLLSHSCGCLLGRNWWIVRQGSILFLFSCFFLLLSN